MTVLEWSQLLVNLVAAAASLGLVGGVLSLIRWLWQRRRWHEFIETVDSLEQIHFGFDDSEEWKALAAHALNKAGFSPKEASGLLAFAAKLAESRGRFAEPTEGHRDG